jgi:hypothetical protein
MAAGWGMTSGCSVERGTIIPVTRSFTAERVVTGILFIVGRFFHYQGYADPSCTIHAWVSHSKNNRTRMHPRRKKKKKE